ncbi:cancer-associated gene 1 protein [Discoglossus pictus]
MVMSATDGEELKINTAANSQSYINNDNNKCDEDDSHEAVKSNRNNYILGLLEEARILKEAHSYLRIFENFLNEYTKRKNELVNEKLQLHKMASELNETLKRLKRNQKRQQTQIQVLQHENISMMTKIQEMWFDTQLQCKINEAEETPKLNIEDFPTTQKQLLKNKKAGSSLKVVVQENPANVHKRIDEADSDNDFLKRQLEKLKLEHRQLQQKHKEQMELKAKSINKCLELGYNLCKKEEEIKQIQCQQVNLENKVPASSLGLQKLTGDIDSLNKTLVSLQKELEKEAATRRTEKEQFEFNLNRLVAEVKLLQSEFQKGQAETADIKRDIDMMKKENIVHQSSVYSKDENNLIHVEIERKRRQNKNINELRHEKV